MDIWSWVVAIFLGIFFLIFIIGATEIICSFFAKRRFKLFLQKANQDPLLKALIEKILAQKINLVPMCRENRRKICLLQPQKSERIAVSNGIIKDFLSGQLKASLLALGLAHELGHLQYFQQIQKLTQLDKERKKSCNVRKFKCLYEEMIASAIGLKILNRVAAEKKIKIDLKKISTYLKESAVNQCLECIVFLKNPENAQKCPRFKFLPQIGITIKEGKGVSVSVKIL